MDFEYEKDTGIDNGYDAGSYSSSSNDFDWIPGPVTKSDWDSESASGANSLI